MQPDSPSRTAWSAAGHRAAHQVLEDGRIFRDPLALTVLGKHAALAVEHARQAPHRRLMRLFIAVRHRVAEDAVAEDVRRGTRQVIVLGAGLDTFAYRSPLAHPGVSVVEVDHPASQAWKRELLARTGIPVPPTTTYAPVDFETDDLTERLAASGVDLGAPTAFVWLGVVPYLTPEAVREMLGALATLPRASVTFDYPNPPEQLSDAAREARERQARAVEELGEPWLASFDTTALRDELAGLGFDAVDDLGPREIAMRWFGAPAATRTRAGGHVVVARRR